MRGAGGAGSGNRPPVRPAPPRRHWSRRRCPLCHRGHRRHVRPRPGTYGRPPERARRQLNSNSATTVPGPIVDAHFHVWDPVKRQHDWLQGAPPELRRRFDIDEFATIARACGVGASVVVEAVDTPQEAQDFVEVAGANNLVAGVVGWVDLAAEDVADAIAAWRHGPAGEVLVGACPMRRGARSLSPNWSYTAGTSPRPLASRSTCRSRHFERALTAWPSSSRMPRFRPSGDLPWMSQPPYHSLFESWRSLGASRKARFSLCVAQTSTTPYRP